MKTKTCFLAGVWLLLATVASAAANSDGILIKGRVAREPGQVGKFIQATIICGDTQITAAEVVLDRDWNVIRCLGEATVRVGDLTAQVKDLVIEIGNRKVFTLMSDRISMTRSSTMGGVWGKPGVFQEATIPVFRAPASLLPKD